MRPDPDTADTSVSDLIDNLSPAKERCLNQFGMALLI